MEFKVGDKVKIIEGCANCETGEVCVLKMGDKDGACGDILFAHGQATHANCVCENNWKLVESQPKLNIGDKVKIIKRLPDNTTGAGYGDVGKIGEIMDYGSKTFRVDCGGVYLGRFTVEELEKQEPGFSFALSNSPAFKLTADNIQESIMDYLIYIGSEKPKKEKSFMTNAVDFVKKQALKISSPDEFELREAGLHDNCGDLTTEGRALIDSFLEDLVSAKMIATARAINEEAKANK